MFIVERFFRGDSAIQDQVGIIRKKLTLVVVAMAVSSLEVGDKITVDDTITVRDEMINEENIIVGDKMTVAVEGIIIVRNVIMFILGLDSGYIMKSGLSPQEFPRSCVPQKLPCSQTIFNCISFISS